MGWFRKTFHKLGHSIKKDWRKVSRIGKHSLKGRFHVGHSIRSTLPKRLRKRFDKLRWSKLVKGKLLGNNSASTIAVGADVPTNSYVYQGKSISELM